MKTSLIALCAIALAIVSPLRADDATVEKQLAKMPKAAADALRKAAGTAKIVAIDIGKEGKIVTYEADYKEEGKPEREVTVKGDGTILVEEYTMPLADVPAAAKAAIEAGAKGATIKRVNHMNRQSKITYEALYDNKGKETEVEYLEDGTLKPE